MTDMELLALYRDDVSTAVRETVRLYLPYVRAIAADKLAAFTKEDIEETVSDIFIRFWRTVEGVDLSRGSIRAYICVLAKSIALRKRAQLAGRLETEGGDMPDTAEASPGISPEEKSEMIDALSLLPEEERSLILMKYYFGLSHKEIGKALHISAKAAQKRTERALKKLKERIGGLDDDL